MSALSAICHHHHSWGHSGYWETLFKILIKCLIEEIANTEYFNSQNTSEWIETLSLHRIVWLMIQFACFLTLVSCSPYIYCHYLATELPVYLVIDYVSALL